MKIEIKYDKNKSLLSSILFLILGALFLSNADILYQIVSIGIGSILLIYSVIRIYIYMTNKDDQLAKVKLLKGVIIGVIGLIFIVFPGIVESSVRYLLGAWVLFSGIHQLISSLSLSSNNKHLLTSFLISILLIALSIFIIFTDILTDSIGIVMIIYSSIEILGIIFNRTDKKKTAPKEGEMELIIPDKKKK